MADRILIVILLAVIAFLSYNVMGSQFDEVYREGKIEGYSIGKGQCAKTSYKFSA